MKKTLFMKTDLPRVLVSAGVGFLFGFFGRDWEYGVLMFIIWLASTADWSRKDDPDA